MKFTEQQPGREAGAAGDENRGQRMVFDTKLLSGKTQNPGRKAGVVARVVSRNDYGSDSSYRLRHSLITQMEGLLRGRIKRGDTF